MSEEMLKLFNERVEMFRNVTEHKPTDRIPIMAITDNWALFYYGTTLKEALKDPKLEHAAYVKGICDFDYDASAFAGITTPMNFVASLGGGMYDTNSETLQIQTGASEHMSSDEYDQLIADPYKFIQNTVLERKFALFRNKSTLSMFFQLSKSLAALGGWAGEKSKAIADFKNNYGIPVLNSVPTFVAPDVLLDGLRDFKGLSLDIRRCPDKVAEACMAFTEQLSIPSIRYGCGEPSDEIYPQLYLHLPPWISPKQFEKVYWPCFKRYTDEFHDRGFKMIIFFEKSYAHLYNYLKDLQKNFIIGCFEDDDPVTVKKELGDVITFCGGMPTQDLMYNTPEGCVEVAKKVVDEMAPGGAFVFAPNKILLARNDAKPENLKAVTSFVKEYAKY